MSAKPAKRLQELLREKQEPFILDIHLVERGYLKRCLHSKSSLTCCPWNSRHSLSRTVSSSDYIDGGNPHSSKVLKDTCNQARCTNKWMRARSHNHNIDIKFAEKKNSKQNLAAWSDFLAGDPTTAFYARQEANKTESKSPVPNQEDRSSFTAWPCQSFTLSKKPEYEAKIALEDRKFHWQLSKDYKQHNAKSVQEKKPPHETSTFKNNFSTLESKNYSETCTTSLKGKTESSILSISLWKMQLCKGVAKIQNSLHHEQKHSKSSTIFQQTTEILFDCVTETQEWKKQKQHKECLSSEESVKLCNKKIKAWGVQANQYSNLTKFGFRLLESQEWSTYEQQQEGLGEAIADIILEEIRDGIIIEMIGFGN